MLTDFQKTCLNLAKNSILQEFGMWDPYKIQINDPQFQEKRACFVTLKMDGELRGCIGSIVPHNKLYEDIITNAKNAAFQDPRFPQLNLDEIQENDLNIGITILSPIQDKEFSNHSDLLNFLTKEKCWLIIKLWYRQATFLPSVREELPQANEFITHLLLKAWISINEFQNDFDKFKFQIYYWEEFKSDRESISW